MNRLRAGALILACLAVLPSVLAACTRADDAPGQAAATTGIAEPGVPGRPTTSRQTATSGRAATTVTTSVSATATIAPARTPRPTARTSRTAAPSPAAGRRTITLVNRLHETIWPAIAADPAHPIPATGWVLPPGASLSFPIPDHWDVRLWARTGCTFTAAGKGHCLTGDCGTFQCGRTWGEFPSTLAEFNLNAWNGLDFYDVSLVEGNNLPMWINSYGGSSRDPIGTDGCAASGCTRDANRTCPAPLQRIRNGKVVACLSACLVFKTDQICCTAAYSPRSRCTPSTWPVNSAAVFKKAEPFAYSYVDDDATSVLTCSGECGYRITWGVSP